MTKYYDSIPTENELREKRMMDYELMFDAQWDRDCIAVSHNGIEWCDKVWTERPSIFLKNVDDCLYSKVGTKFATMCDYYGWK